MYNIFANQTIGKETCMVYIFTALYCEAQIFIRQFHLSKNPENTWFQEFHNASSGIRLTVTGVGEIAAAAAVSSICSMYRPTDADLLLNVGICAHTDKTDGIFLCNKLIELATGKTFYPDMLYRHDFCEGAIVTGMLPWNAAEDGYSFSASTPDGILYDMEAAAVYQAGIRFFSPHQMAFLKVVSDNGRTAAFSREQAALLMEQYQDCITDYITRTAAIIQEHRSHKNELQEDEQRLFETFCADLHCSKAMRDSMRQYIRYLALSDVNYIGMIRDMYEKNLLPCKDKKEGKRRFEEFKKRIF